MEKFIELALAGIGSGSLDAYLGEAIKNDSIHYHYQPIALLATGQVLGFESLARWQLAPNVLRPPVELPISKEMLLAFDLYSVRKALETIEAQKKQLNGRFISVNIEPISLIDNEFCNQLYSLLKAHPQTVRGLLIEITERLPDEGVSSLFLENVRQISTLGAKVAIDDFGSGWNPIKLLTNAPIDAVKIDTQTLFSADNNQREKYRIILKNMISMCKELGVDLICEFVETTKQRDELLELGVLLAQGYLLGRPSKSLDCPEGVAVLEK